MLILALLLAAQSSDFDKLKESALAVDRPASAIQIVIGACEAGDPIEQQECRKNIDAKKKELAGRRVHMNLGAGHEAFLAFESLTGETAKFVWAPLYDAGNGLAITGGKPQKLSPAGNVVVGKRPFTGPVNVDFMEGDLSRMAKLGQLTIEVIGKLGAPWQLAAGEKTARGVALEIEAIRLTNNRTGKRVADLKP